MTDIPDKESRIVGGPFDGRTEYFNINDWTPEETRYQKFYEEGIIEDLTLYSINFPEGAKYSWDNEKRYWNYIGKPDRKSQKEARKLFRAFGLKPANPL